MTIKQKHENRKVFDVKTTNIKKPLDEDFGLSEKELKAKYGAKYDAYVKQLRDLAKSWQEKVEKYDFTDTTKKFNFFKIPKHFHAKIVQKLVEANRFDEVPKVYQTDEIKNKHKAYKNKIELEEKKKLAELQLKAEKGIADVKRMSELKKDEKEFIAGSIGDAPVTNIPGIEKLREVTFSVGIRNQNNGSMKYVDLRADSLVKTEVIKGREKNGDPIYALMPALYSYKDADPSTFIDLKVKDKTVQIEGYIITVPPKLYHFSEVKDIVIESLALDYFEIDKQKRPDYYTQVTFDELNDEDYDRFMNMARREFRLEDVNTYFTSIPSILHQAVKEVETEVAEEKSVL